MGDRGTSTILMGAASAAEVASASTALAGLLLVYLGSLATSYGSFTPQERRAVRKSHYTRGWTAFCGMVICLLAAAAAIAAKWGPSEGLGDLAVVLLGIGFVFAGWSAYMTVSEIK